MLNWRQNYHRMTDPLEGSISQEHTRTVLFNDVNELVLFFFFSGTYIKVTEDQFVGWKMLVR